MNKQIFINLTVNDLAKSTLFYQTLGFEKVDGFSNDVASCMKWSEEIFFMLLLPEFMKNFIQDKKIADMNVLADSTFAFNFDSKEEVDSFLAKAKAVNARIYTNPFQEQFEFMYGKSVLDPDGHILEAFFMDMSKAENVN